MAQHKAVFLDRDGVINEDRGYVGRVEDFCFIEGVFEACRALNRQGFKLIVATNQSGIGRGYFTERDFQTLNRWMLDRFDEAGVCISGVYYCPDHPEHGVGRYRRDSPYRKPNPQMLLDAALEHDIDLTGSWLVGDKLSDIQAGRTAGVGRCFLITDDPAPAGVAGYPSLYQMVQSEFSQSNENTSE